MKRLITDEPHNGMEWLLNCAHGEDDGKIYLNLSDDGPTELKEYLDKFAAEMGCNECDAVDNEEKQSEPCGCDCWINVLATVATQAAMLREALRTYEEAANEQTD